MNLTKLREIRQMKRISIKELATNIGLNRDRLSLIERGLVNPSFKTVQDIVDALGCELVVVLK